MLGSDDRYDRARARAERSLRIQGYLTTALLLVTIPTCVLALVLVVDRLLHGGLR
jgi:hypothetical protein